MSSLCLAYTPAMQRLYFWNEDLYKQVFGILDRVTLTELQGVPAASYDGCNFVVKVQVKQIFQGIKGQLPAAAHRSHESAVLDMICCAYLKKQQAHHNFPSPEMVEQESRSRNLVRLWQTVVDRSTTHNTCGHKFKEFFEARTASATFRRLLQESLVMDCVYQGRFEKIEDFVSRAVNRPELTTKSGHYMIVLTDANDPTWYRVYVGQAADVKKRINGHHGKKREKALTDSPTLIYKFWNAPGRTAHIFRIGEYSPEMNESEKDKNRWLCLVELFYCLLFQSLQPQLLSQLLGRVVATSPGLNVQSPLQQGETARGSSCGFGAAFSNPDPEVRKAAFDHMDRIREMGKEVLRADGHAKNASGIFKAKGSARLRERQAGDPDPIMIRCNSCKSDKSKRIDTAPKFCVLTGKYVVRQSRCLGSCQLNPSEKGKRTLPSRWHSPVNLPRTEWFSQGAFKTFCDKNPLPQNPQQPSVAEPIEQIQDTDQRDFAELLGDLEPEDFPDDLENEDQSTEGIVADILDGLEAEDFEDDFDTESLDKVENVDAVVADLLEGIDPTEFDDFMTD